jgi:glycosyltransferase involved in cell wall biosynthesis
MPNQESQPLISVVMPVHSGAATLDRALQSVVAQTFRDWEVLAVDDASTDESSNILRRWAAEDGRIRLFRLDENRGASASRNVAIQNARGPMVSYLDHDDEYYPNYLELVARHRDKGDVLVFGYDFVYEDRPAGSRPESWDPGSVRQFLFVQPIVTPLGVAHRRELWQRAGGFNELVSGIEDWDFWKRLARAGAEFAFLPLKSGLYHVRADSISRMPRLTRRQKEKYLENWRKGRSIFEDGDREAASPHPNPLPAGEGTRDGPILTGEGTFYVTLVNPEPRKGIHIFARIAEVLSRRRPDIPLLIVEGAGKARFLSRLGIDLGGVKNLRIVPNSPDARGFLQVTKMLLMPSLMENAGLVAMEAMLNGIPVLASNRGALPETIGDAGFLFDIPVRYTPETRDVPTAEEVEPWVETIIRLWDDASFYDGWSRAARERAQQWHPDRLTPIYREFFGRLTHQPGPPLVPGHLHTPF